MRHQRFDTYEALGQSLRLKVMMAGEVRAGTEWGFLDHPAPYNRFYMVYAGQGYVGRERQQQAFGPGRLILAPCGSRLDYVCTGRLHKLYVHFRLELYPGRDLFSGLAAAQGGVGKVSDFKRLAQLMSARQVGEHVAAHALLLNLLAPFIRLSAPEARRAIGVREKYQGLFSRVAEAPTLELNARSLAPLCGLAPATLVKAFRRDTGQGLDAWIRERLVERAKDRLLFTQVRVKELARELGFHDEFYFSRFFKRHAGLSPLAFRRTQAP